MTGVGWPVAAAVFFLANPIMSVFGAQYAETAGEALRLAADGMRDARVAPVDRDQWTTILHTVSANTAYRWLYNEGLKPWLVAELLILRRELPRSVAASADRQRRRCWPAFART